MINPSPLPSAEQFEQAVKTHNISRWDTGQCTDCNGFIGYVFQCGMPFFDSACGCGWSSPKPRFWQDIADAYQYHPEHRIFWEGKFEAKQRTGTTLGILALYLEHGIQIEMLWFPLDEDRHILRGLDCSAPASVLAEGRTCSPAACLPVLYAFEDLVTPLPDGTVPAVEVAKLALTGSKSECFTIDRDARLLFGEREFKRSGVTVNYTDSEFQLVISISKAWQVSILNNGNADQPDSYLVIINYLRSKHFAVGLDSSQYIRKTHEPQPTL